MADDAEAYAPDDSECSECARGYPPHETDGHWLHYQTCVGGLVGTFPCRDRLDDSRDTDPAAD